MVFWNGGSSLDLVFLPLDSQDTVILMLRLKTKVCLKLLSRSLWPWPGSCCRGGCPQGKPDWFWKGVEFTQAFSVIKLGAVFAFEKDKLDTRSDAIPTVHYIQHSVSALLLCAQLHTPQGLSTKWQRQRKTALSRGGMRKLLKIWKVHTFSGKTGEVKLLRIRMEEEGCVMRSFEMQSWEVSGCVLTWRDTHHQDVGGVGGVSSGVGARPVLRRIQDLL